MRGVWVVIDSSGERLSGWELRALVAGGFLDTPWGLCYGSPRVVEWKNCQWRK